MVAYDKCYASSNEIRQQNELLQKGLENMSPEYERMKKQIRDSSMESDAARQKAITTSGEVVIQSSRLRRLEEQLSAAGVANEDLRSKADVSLYKVVGLTNRAVNAEKEVEALSLKLANLPSSAALGTETSGQIEVRNQEMKDLSDKWSKSLSQVTEKFNETKNSLQQELESAHTHYNHMKTSYSTIKAENEKYKTDIEWYETLYNAEENEDDEEIDEGAAHLSLIHI